MGVDFQAQRFGDASGLSTYAAIAEDATKDVSTVGGRKVENCLHPLAVGVFDLVFPSEAVPFGLFLEIPIAID